MVLSPWRLGLPLFMGESLAGQLEGGRGKEGRKGGSSGRREGGGRFKESQVWASAGTVCVRRNHTALF